MMSKQKRSCLVEIPLIDLIQSTYIIIPLAFEQAVDTQNDTFLLYPLIMGICHYLQWWGTGQLQGANHKIQTALATPPSQLSSQFTLSYTLRVWNAEKQQRAKVYGKNHAFCCNLNFPKDATLPCAHREQQRTVTKWHITETSSNTNLTKHAVLFVPVVSSYLLPAELSVSTKETIVCSVMGYLCMHGSIPHHLSTQQEAQSSAVECWLSASTGLCDVHVKDTAVHLKV